MSIWHRLLYWIGLRSDPGPRKYEVTAPLQVSLKTLAQYIKNHPPPQQISTTRACENHSPRKRLRAEAIVHDSEEQHHTAEVTYHSQDRCHCRQSLKGLMV